MGVTVFRECRAEKSGGKVGAGLVTGAPTLIQKQAAEGTRGLFDGIISGKFRQRESQKLPIGHFLRHVQNELAIFFVGFAQQTAKLVEKARFLAAAAPGDVIG